MIPGQINIILKCIAIILFEISFIFLPVYSGYQADISTQTKFTSEDPGFREKVFLHIDRKLYLSGETIRFKGYCIHHTFNLPVELSKVLYVEVMTNQNQQILAGKVNLTGGKGHGYLYIPRSIQTGIYYLIAYTRWMTNFDPENYFAEKIFIVNPFLPLETIPDSSKVTEDYFIHLFAEGNTLRNGQKNEIAFRATDQRGNDVSLKGWVVHASGDTMTSFHTWQYGFGLISFTPQSDNSYKIITISTNGRKKTIPLSFPVTDITEIPDSFDNITAQNGRKLNVTIQQTRDLYTIREKVILNINTADQTGKPVAADMSLSIYKSDEYLNFYHKNIFQYLNYTSYLPASSLPPDDQVPFSAYDSALLTRIFHIIYSSIGTMDPEISFPPDGKYVMPETRGMIITGTVFNNSNRRPVPDAGIYLASPGGNTQLYKYTSGSDGRFSVQLFDQYGRNDIIVIPAENTSDNMIILDEEFPGKPGNFPPLSFWPDEKTIKYIERLMVSLQIADAFQENQENSGNRPASKLPNIFGDPDELVLLEDYIRLPGVEELFYELVQSVNIKRRRNNFDLMIADYTKQLSLPGEPLLLLDGVPVTDVNSVILYLDPIDIERIEVFSDYYVQGSEFYYSIISIITKQADFGHFDLPSNAIRKPFQFFQYPEPVHSPDYSSDGDSLKTFPDFRNLLYWNPEIITDTNGTATVSFYTSDDISDYRIIIQGITEDGLCGYLETTISVIEPE